MKKMLWILFMLLSIGILQAYDYRNFRYSELSDNDKEIINQRRLDNVETEKAFNQKTNLDWKFEWWDDPRYLKKASVTIIEPFLYDSTLFAEFCDSLLIDFVELSEIAIEDLTLSNVTKGKNKDFFTVRYLQHVNAIYFNSKPGIAFNYRNNKLTVFISCIPDDNLNSIPKLSFEDAWEKAKNKAISENEYSMDDAREAVYKGGLKLVWKSESIPNSGNPLKYSEFSLVYIVIIRCHRYIIDAVTGEIKMGIAYNVSG